MCLLRHKLNANIYCESYKYRNISADFFRGEWLSGKTLFRLSYYYPNNSNKKYYH